MNTSIVFEFAVEILLVEMVDEFGPRHDPGLMMHQIG